MTFELETLLIDYRRETTQIVLGFLCKIYVKLQKNSDTVILYKKARPN